MEAKNQKSTRQFDIWINPLLLTNELFQVIYDVCLKVRVNQNHHNEILKTDHLELKHKSTNFSDTVKP